MVLSVCFLWGVDRIMLRGRWKGGPEEKGERGRKDIKSEGKAEKAIANDE